MNPALLIAAVVSIGTAQSRPSSTTRTPREALTRDLFAMDTATRDERHPTPDSQVRLIKELGYAGWAPSWTPNLSEMLKALDEARLPMVAVYVGINLDADGPGYDSRLKNNIAALKGRATIVWLYVTSSRHTPSSVEGDARAVKIIHELADLAEPAGLRIALYPHTGFYVEKVADATRLVEKAGRRGVGVTFNLCHWLKSERGQKLEDTLGKAMPHLFIVTINGADREGTDWDRLIQPLGMGDYDVAELLGTLQRLGYTGPIGFQGYGIKGDVRENLRSTLAAWRAYRTALPPDPPAAGQKQP